MKKKNILFIYENLTVRKIIADMLSDIYDFTFAENSDEGLKFTSKKSIEIAAVLISEEIAAANDFEFLIKSRIDKKLTSFPIIIIYEDIPDKVGLKCLEMGALDFITPPFCKELMINRIENSITFANSASFYDIQRMLEVLPSNIYIKDAEGRYIFATHYWHHLEHNDDPDWSIRGKTDVEIRKDRDNAIAAMEADKELVRTGKGTSYIIEINTDGITEFLEINKHPIKDENGTVIGIAGLINIVTEQEILKKQLKDASIIDGLTGLYNRKEIQGKIQQTVLDVRESSMEASVLMFDLDNFKLVNDTYGHRSGDSVLVVFSGILRNNQASCSGKLIPGRWGGEEFMMLLNDTNITAATYIAELIRKCFENTSFNNMRSQTVSIGATQIRKDDTMDSLCSRVDDALYSAKKTGKNKVVAI